MAELRGAWQRQAAEWIAWARTPGHDSYWRFHRDAFLPLVPPAGRLTVDVGCGEGRLARDLARIGHKVVGVDASRELIQAAAQHPQARVRFVVADAAHLPLAAKSADSVVAFMSLQDVDNLEGVIGEIGRILEPGGRLVLAVVHPLTRRGSSLVSTTTRPGRLSSVGHGSPVVAMPSGSNETGSA
jgi:ubiquinone/menaquinone biosynthesis C-methylase UbiE